MIARRVVVRKLVDGRSALPLERHGRTRPRPKTPSSSSGSAITKKLDRLLGELRGSEAAVVRMYHLEGKTYQEISHVVGMPENSVGPMLSRARSKMRRRAGADQPTA